MSQGWPAGGLVCGDRRLGGELPRTTVRVVGTGPDGGLESIKGTYTKKVRSVRFRLRGHALDCRYDRFKVRFTGMRVR